jgi:hypothetical protein
MDQEKGWIQAPRWIEYTAKKLPGLGYKPVKIEKWGFFGAYIIQKDKYKGEDGNKSLTEWEKIVGPKLLEKALKKSAVISRNMRRAASRERAKFAKEEQAKLNE